jgi:2-C-methyl-D-erythritol 4-phosphate cytidylyltransferase
MHSLRFFAALPDVAQVVVAFSETHQRLVSRCRLLLGDYNDRVVWVVGGETRQASVQNAISYLASDCEWVAVHDAARPLVDRTLYRSVLKAALATGAALPGLPIPDTLKRIAGDGCVRQTMEREGLFAAQTPQIFLRTLLEKAFQKADQEGFLGTDESSLVERLGVGVTITPGSRRNLKITLSSDLALAEWILNHKGWK